MNHRAEMWDRPNWLVYLLLLLFHFATVKLSFFCAVTPENQVVVWLPNAVLLAALLRFRGQRAWLMALLTFSSDVLGNVHAVQWNEAVQLGLIDVYEVVMTYLLMRRAKASPRLERIQDLGKFVLAGPLLSALFAGILGAIVIKAHDGGTPSYLSLMRLWWFGDGLGLLIYTPLLLTFTQPASEVVHFNWIDTIVVLLGLGLGMQIFSAHGAEAGHVALTPTLLLPFVLYIAVRFGARWTSLAVALISLASSWALTTGHQSLGGMPVHVAIMQAQEFILTLCIIGMGFAILLSELKAHQRELLIKVRERTLELEESNSKLAALSMTDGLTGIANRRRFDEVLSIEWRRASRSRQPLALALVDVDWFKKYNDCYGHLAGDDCLRTVASVFTANIRRSGDLVARYGGEEFAFIAPAMDEASALRMAETVCQALVDLGLPHRQSPFGVVSVSIGVAVLVPEEGESADTLLKLADEALYQIKESGRNQARLAEALVSK